MTSGVRFVDNDVAGSSKVSYYILCAYFFFEFARPQTLLPPVSQLHIPFFLVVLIVFRILRDQKKHLSLKGGGKLFFGFFILLVIQIPIALNNFRAYETTRLIFATFVVLFGIIVLPNSMKELLDLLRFWTFTFVLLACIGLANGGAVPGSAYFGDENDFALAMNVALPLAFLFVLRADSLVRKMVWMIGMLIIMTAVVASMSRGGFLGLIAVSLYIWYRLPRKIIGTVIGLILVTVVFINVPEQYWKEMKTITAGTDDSTGGTRWHYWTTGFNMFLHNPFIGVGPGNFPWRIQEYEPSGGHQGRMHGGRPAHSVYVTLISELGIAGLILFVSTLIAYFKSRKKILTAVVGDGSLNRAPPTKKNPLAHLVFSLDGSIIAYLTSGFFLSVLYYPYYWLLLGFGISAALRVKNGIGSNVSERVV